MKRLIPKRVRELLLRVIHSNESKAEVAGGLAVGIFVGFLPIIGFHMPLAFVLTRLLRKNSFIAMASTWIVNPLNALPAFLFNLWVGKFLYGGNVDFTGLASIVKTLNLSTLLSAGKEVLIPLWLGSILVGLVAAFISQRLCLRYYERIRDKLLKTKEAIHFRTHDESKTQKKPGAEFSR